MTLWLVILFISFFTPLRGDAVQKCRQVFDSLTSQGPRPAFLTPADTPFSDSLRKIPSPLPALEEFVQGFSKHRALFDSTFSKVTLPLTGNQAVDTFRKDYNRGFFTNHNRFITYWHNGYWVEREVFAVHNKGVVVRDEYANLYAVSVIALRTARVSGVSRQIFISDRQSNSLNLTSLSPGQEVAFFHPHQGLKYGRVESVKTAGTVHITYRDRGRRHQVTRSQKDLLTKEAAPYSHLVSAPVGPHGMYMNVKVKQLFFNDTKKENPPPPQKFFITWKAEGELQGRFMDASDLRPFRDPFDPRYMKALKNSELEEVTFLHTPGVKDRVLSFLNNKLHPMEGYQPYRFVNPHIEGVGQLPHRLSRWRVDTGSPPLQHWMHKATTLIKTKTGLQPRADHDLSLREQHKIYQVYLNDIVPQIKEIKHSPPYDFLRTRLLVYDHRDLGQVLEEGAAVCLELSLFGLLLFGEYGIKAKVGIGTVEDHPKSSHAWIQTFDKEGHPLRIIDSNYTNDVHVSWEEYKSKALLSSRLGEWPLTGVRKGF